MMDNKVLDCIKQYIKENYLGGIIKVSSISEYCGCSEGIILRNLVELERRHEVRIEKRYSCPEFHYVRDKDIPFCPECDYEYPEELINVYFYFKPLVLKTEE